MIIRREVLVCMLLIAANITCLAAQSSYEEYHESEYGTPSSQTLRKARPQLPVSIGRPSARLNGEWNPDIDNPNTEPVPVAGGAIILTAMALGYGMIRKRRVKS